MRMMPSARPTKLSSAGPHSVVPGERPQLHYRWEGEHEDAIGQIYGGHGVMWADATGDARPDFYVTMNFDQNMAATDSVLPPLQWGDRMWHAFEQPPD